MKRCVTFQCRAADTLKNKILPRLSVPCRDTEVMTMKSITGFETQVLALVDQCGGSRVDLSGTRFNAEAKAAARECLRKGLLCGEPSALNITEAGQAAMKRRLQAPQRFHRVALACER